MFSNARQSIPQLFRVIMENDKLISNLVSSPVINLKLFKEARQRKRELIIAADKYVANQKKGTD